MDKLTKGKFLPSNLPWFFNHNKKVAEESKPAGIFDRLSKNKNTQTKKPPTTVPQSLKRPRKVLSQDCVLSLGSSSGLRSLTEVCPGSASSCSHSALPWRSPHTQNHLFQTALWGPFKRCRSIHLWTEQNAESKYKRIFSYIKTTRGGKQWENGKITVHHLSQIKFKSFAQRKIIFYFFTGTCTKNTNICTVNI